MNPHPLDKLAARDKPPATRRAIETWIQQAEASAGIGASRLGWMVAASIVIAALQRITQEDAQPRFLLKGGAYLEFRLGIKARATQDIDTLFRGDFHHFIDKLDEVLAEPFAGITFRRTEPETIQIPGRLVNPIRLNIVLSLRGRTWRKVILEVAPDEGQAGSNIERFRFPSLAHFGLPTPETIAGISVAYQVAQKLHACSAPHAEDHPNYRVRDIVDLILIKREYYSNLSSLDELKAACEDVYSSRNKLVSRLPARFWPPVLLDNPLWRSDYVAYAKEIEMELPLDDALNELNNWIAEIAK
ncbi:MAG: nucleotidyl transferase AbiEii/AbiGii toxin family protein [Deltaproteobacteria bacterium]|nr:nucleotidyl transferase AbiEii/AbiGii toxin family protein [Deltaproteobacteria bacterium]